MPGHLHLVARHRLWLFLSREVLAFTGIEMKETGVYGLGAVFEVLIPIRK